MDRNFGLCQNFLLLEEDLEKSELYFVYSQLWVKGFLMNEKTISLLIHVFGQVMWYMKHRFKYIHNFQHLEAHRVRHIGIKIWHNYWMYHYYMIMNYVIINKKRTEVLYESR